MIRTMLFGLLGLAALAVGLVGWVGLSGSPADAPAPVAAAPPPPPPAMVLVAVRTVQAGALLRPEDLEPRAMLAAALPADAVPDSAGARESFRGAMVRRSLAPGEPVRLEGVLRPGDHGFLAAVLAPGARAATIGVDAVTGTAGLIWPGDRVDVILTQALDAQDTAPAHRVSGERVLEDVRVIAVDRSLMQGAHSSGAPGGALGDAARTVTLEVSAEGATRVAVAARLGRLSLAVRAVGPAPGGTAPAPASSTGARPAVLWGGDVSSALTGPNAAATPEAAARSVSVRVFQGSSKMEEIRFR